MGALRAELPPDEPQPQRLPALVRLARPKQWVKNVLVVAAPGAAGVLGDGKALWRTGIAFVCFCLAASGTYFLNDALDADADRAHPTKRRRPIASGEVTSRTAITGGVLLVAGAIALSFAARWQLSLVVGGYLAQTILYSVWLKHEAVLDLACVASGFV
ncbi:MAG TPA: UbiA family prenyltransferase, partial [Acidimicrobiia bacterium]|nr:UbiA family prenyltransferase [Acidimicrobiia bacterium]